MTSSHTSCERRVLGFRWSEFVRSVDVDCVRPRVPSGSTSPMAYPLFGHTALMSNIVPAKAILSTACNVHDGRCPSTYWKRPRRRPPTTCLHQVTMQSLLPECHRGTYTAAAPFHVKIRRCGRLGYAMMVVVMMMMMMIRIVKHLYSAGCVESFANNSGLKSFRLLFTIGL